MQQNPFASAVQAPTRHASTQSEPGRRNFSWARNHGRSNRALPTALLALLVALSSMGLNDSASGIDDRPIHIWPIYYPGDHGVARDSATADRIPPDALLERFMQLHSASRYQEALDVIRELQVQQPDHPVVLYNLACVHARLHQTDEALAAFEAAIEAGWRRVSHTDLDPDLRSLRWTDRYRELRRQMQVLINAEVPPTRKLREEPWPEVAAELEAMTPALLRRHRVPGATVVLIRNGRIVWAEAFGRRDGEHAMQVHDRIAMESPTRLLAVMGVLAAQQRGSTSLASLLRASDDLQPRGGRFAGGGARRPVEHLNRAEPQQLLRLSLEMDYDRPFAEICTKLILDPLEIASAQFARHAPDDIETIGGHTIFGSPIARSQEQRYLTGDTLYLSASDLAQLIEQLTLSSDRPRRSRRSDPAPAEAHPPQLLNRASVTELLHLGLFSNWHPRDLGVRARSTELGPMFEIAEHRAGAGCLARWYPRHGNGIVVIYNGQDGALLADHLARSALGGG